MSNFNGSDIILPNERSHIDWSDQWPVASVPVRPYDHIIGNLYVGGITNDTNGFRYIFCCTPDKTYYGNSKQVIHLVTFHDTEQELPPEWFIDDVVARVVECCQKGPTFVHCSAGLNRSGLIAALALVKTGNFTPAEAIKLLREKRAENMLCNTLFERRVLQGPLRPTPPSGRLIH